MVSITFPPVFNRFKLQQLIVLAFVIVCAAINTVSYKSYQKNEDQTASREWMQQTYDILRVTGDVQFTVQDMAIALRGYLLTGDKDFVTPYEAAHKKLQPTLLRLSGLTHDNLARQRQLADLRKVLVVQEGLMQRQFDRYNQGLGVSLAEMEKSRVQMDEIHKVYMDLTDAEQRLLLSRFSDENIRQDHHIQTLFIMSWLALFVLVLLTVKKQRLT